MVCSSQQIDRSGTGQYFGRRLTHNVARVADRVVIAEFTAGVLLGNAPLVYIDGKVSLEEQKGKARAQRGMAMPLLTALGLGDVGDGDGELRSVLSSNQSQRGERDDSGGRVHLVMVSSKRIDVLLRSGCLLLLLTGSLCETRMLIRD